MNRPRFIKLEDVVDYEIENGLIWSFSFLKEKITDRINLPYLDFPDEPQPGTSVVVAVGGGVLLDTAKIWRKEKSPQTRLIAIPSIWGSGAENSPIAIVNTSGSKVFAIGDEYLPDIRTIWAELAVDAPPELLQYACGDVWAHAIEGFFSPLMDISLQQDNASLLLQMLNLPIGFDERWFEISAQACRAQASASAGLVHGIAHVLEPLLQDEPAEGEIGHARLCASLLLPVWRFNCLNSDKPDTLFKLYGIDTFLTESKLGQLFDQPFYNKTVVPAMEHNWLSILRDPSSRTNCALVRQRSLEYFTAFQV